MNPGLARSLLLAALVAAPGAALAQGSPPLGAMPPPPSASDPLPRESAKRKPTTEKPAQAAKSRPQQATEGREGATASRRSGGAATTQTFERPKRFVPEEFDRDSGEGSRAKPFVTESGRPGMGMRF